MDVVDDIGRIGALHVEIDLLLFEQLCELKQCRSYNDLALDVGRRGKLARDITHKIVKMLLDLLLMYFRDDSQRDRFSFHSLRRLSRGVRARDRAEEESGNCCNDENLAPSSLHDRVHRG